MSSVRARAAALLFVLSLGALALVLRAPAGPPLTPTPPVPPSPPQPAADERVVVQGFPARAADPADPTRSDTAWIIDWDITSPGNGPRTAMPPSSVLRIASAIFMYKDRLGQPRWIRVAKDLRLGEMFVPYDPGSPRFQDVANHPFWLTKADESFLGPSCVTPGKILTSTDPNLDRRVYKEIHDDGLRWISDGSRSGIDKARRGEKMILWSVFYGANYRYIMEYGFADDGTITCRAGATARNFFSRRADQGDTHLHVGCWRFDPDLGDPTGTLPGGPDKNIVRLARRVPRTPALADGKYRIQVEPFSPSQDNQSQEGGALWNAEEFTTLRLESTVRKNNNDVPQPVAYDLMPLRHGSVRNFPPDLEWVNKDFWVTLSEPSQTTYSEVATYAARQRIADLKPITVWHCSAALHTARAEDFGPDGRSNGTGIALTAWASFNLRPRNLFDSTPLFQNP